MQARGDLGDRSSSVTAPLGSGSFRVLSGPLDLHPTPYLPYPQRSERNLERLYLPYLRGGELRDSEVPHVAS